MGTHLVSLRRLKRIAPLVIVILLRYPHHKVWRSGTFRLATCLPAYLPTCLPAYLPTCLPAYRGPEVDSAGVST